MGISIYKIKTWFKMIQGNSILHVNQGVGKIYSVDGLEGYYNDLTEKVTKGDDYKDIKIPKILIDNGEEIFFPIAIFQYGLGAYDLYLLSSEEIMFKKFKLCADWAIENQENNGAWNTFFFEDAEHPYSSMAQGEGVSLLLRAFAELKNDIYLRAAKKAVEFMLKPIEKGGTAQYSGDEVFLYECTNDPVILNGWIFSLWGLFDYLKVVDDIIIRKTYENSINSLINALPDFDNGFWSKYDLGNMITSPFYHKLHIAQLKVLYDLTKEESFLDYSNKWQEYENRFVNRNIAFFLKAMQKIIE